MLSKLIKLTYEIELQIGEQLTLPDTLVESIGAGRWLITIEPFTDEEKTQVVIRQHDAFLNGYAPENEGLYDDY
ncbi:hypothetical protein [Coleofasciculus sp.]|uniref:hypothetical protein n=1 Tax=Coleofasciculus sp. TaxID=3100458 RepID=UPI003A15FDC8